MRTAIPIDAVIIGGGAAGLWAMDALHHAGHSALLLETKKLGTGQTIASQGIIHGGLKYSLGGLVSRSAAAIRKMPQVWRKSLAGEDKPDLHDTVIRADCCHIWGNRSLGSTVGMMGAKTFLKTKPKRIADKQRPPILESAYGKVFEIHEPVISPASFLRNLADQYRDRILKVAPHPHIKFDLSGAGHVDRILIRQPDQHSNGQSLLLRPGRVILTTGRSNAGIRRLMGLPSTAMQLRPLHMVMARGNADQLPTLNGHCIQGNKTRVTITTDTDNQGRQVWQIGGQIAESGVKMEPAELIAHTQKELAGCLGEFDRSGLEWATYRVDRAEKRTRRFQRPSLPSAFQEGNVITGWPTKLALAPVLSTQIIKLMEKHHPFEAIDFSIFNDWPKPEVASPPWQEQTQWFQDP